MLLVLPKIAFKCSMLSKIASVSGIIYIKFVNEDWVINPFSNNVSLLYPLKTSENRRLSDVLRGYRSGTLL